MTNGVKRVTIKCAHGPTRCSSTTHFPLPILVPLPYQGIAHLAQGRYCRKYVAKARVKVFQLGGVVAAKAVVRLVVAAADVGTWAEYKAGA